MKARYITTKERLFPFLKCPHCGSTGWHIVLEKAGEPNLLYCCDCKFFIKKMGDSI